MNKNENIRKKVFPPLLYYTTEAYHYAIERRKDWNHIISYYTWMKDAFHERTLKDIQQQRISP